MSNTGSSPLVVAPGVETPAQPADFNKLKEEFENVAKSTIGRWVAAGVALAVPVITAFCAWLQKEVGINLDPASLTAFITSIAAGAAILGFKWLSNRGDWERAAVEAYQVYLTGQAATTTTHIAVAQAIPAGPTPPSAPTSRTSEEGI